MSLLQAATTNELGKVLSILLLQLPPEVFHHLLVYGSNSTKLKL